MEFEKEVSVIIASHRLPVKWVRQEVKRADGGLVSVLKDSGVADKAIWLGCHTESPLETSESFYKMTLKNGLLPVTIHQEVHSSFYNGYCNGVLWPAFHNRLDLISYDEKYWNAYKSVNQIFAQKIIEKTPEDVPVWVHDYHLMLLPELIKKAQPQRKVGFFLHIPWPKISVALKVPHLEEISRSLKAADSICFHAPKFRDHFERFLSLNGDLGPDENTYCTPVGIDPKRFFNFASDVKKSGIFKVIGVDRFDYSKGIDLKLLAFHDFLEMNPQLRGSVELHQLLVPTREDVPAYQGYQKEILHLADYINGKFSLKDWHPIHLNIGHMDPDDLAQFYREGDACFVASHADGMNLVSMEYLSAQDSTSPGVLLLSDNTGAACYLKNCVQFQASSIEDAVRSLFAAVKMSKEEKGQRWKADMEWIRSHTAHRYAIENLELLGVDLVKNKHKKAGSVREISASFG